MKLIEILMEALPKVGGWPRFAEILIQNQNGWIINPKLHGSTICKAIQAEDREFAAVTKEEYEAATAASNQPAWNGDGLPPVGCKCELVNFYGNDFPEFVGEHGEEVKIIGTGFTNGCPVAFYEADGGRGGMLAYAVEQCFRPVRTEAEVKSEDPYSSLSEVAKPAIKWINDHANPHAVIIIDATSAVLYSGEKSINTEEFIKD